MPHFTDEIEVEQPLAGKKVLFAEDQEHLRTIIVMMMEERWNHQTRATAESRRSSR